MFLKNKHKYALITDSDLIERYRYSHDANYLGNLYMRYAHLVFGISLNYFKDPDIAQDAVMNIYEVVAKELKKHQVENFKSWLYTLTKNHCLQEIRKNKSKLKKEDAFELFLVNAVETDHEFHLQIKEDKESLLNQLEAALPSLNDAQYLCVKAFYLDNKSYNDIALEINISVKEVKSHIQNGKRNLKIKLSEK